MTPRIHIISADAAGQIDGTLQLNLLNHLPNQVGLADADVVIVPVSYYENYRFNEALRGITKPVVLMDFLEYFGFALKNETHILGLNKYAAPNLVGFSEWDKLHDWVSKNCPSLYFKREMHERDRNDHYVARGPWMHPIEWPCAQSVEPLQSKAEFDARPFELYYSWGFSNSLRPRLAGEIYDLMADGLIEVIASHDHIDAKINETNRRWISVHTPHTHRLPISEIMRRQAQSKMSVSLPGSGRCCFRSVEAPCYTIPVMLDDGHAWSHPWIDGEN